MKISLWEKFNFNFSRIMNDIDEYKKIIDFASSPSYQFNLLFYACKGFPFDLFIDEIIKRKFNIKNLYKTEHTWNKTIIYNENQYFIEIDLDNPNMCSKKFHQITEMLLSIIKTKTVDNKKHLIIIKNIDKLDECFYSFRILLEKYSNNCYFFCSTTRINKIENPIKSRFSMFRLRLFTLNEIHMIFDKYLEFKLNPNFISNVYKNRDIIFAIFVAQTEMNEPLLVTPEFCLFNYPPIKTLVLNKKKSLSLNDIRQLSYKYCQYNYKICDIMHDLFLLFKNKRTFILNIGIHIEILLNQSNKGREPIFIEALLCQVLI